LSATRVKLGSWRCRSGNSVDVFLGSEDVHGVRPLTVEWDSPPPLSDGDYADYIVTIFPALTRRAQEYLEKPGPALGIFL
jgi:hypothetical protein